MRTWRGNELPGGPCPEVVMGTGREEDKVSTTFVSGAWVSTTCFAGLSTAAATAPDFGCE